VATGSRRIPMRKRSGSQKILTVSGDKGLAIGVQRGGRQPTMGALKNPRWERFAQEIASGKHTTNGQAYLATGFQIRPDFAKQNAQKLLRRSEVNARIDELRDLATHVERRAADVAGERLGEDWAIKKEWVTDRLKEIVERSMKEGEFNGNVAC